MASGPPLKRSHSVPLPSIHEVSDELGKAHAGDQAASAPPGRGPFRAPGVHGRAGRPARGSRVRTLAPLGQRWATSCPHHPCWAVPPARVCIPTPEATLSPGAAARHAACLPAVGGPVAEFVLPCSHVQHASLSPSLSPRDLFCDVCLLVSAAVPASPLTHLVGPAASLRPVRLRRLPVLRRAPARVSWPGIGPRGLRVGALHRLYLPDAGQHRAGPDARADGGCATSRSASGPRAVFPGSRVVSTAPAPLRSPFTFAFGAEAFLLHAAPSRRFPGEELGLFLAVGGGNSPSTAAAHPALPCCFFWRHLNQAPRF